MIFQSRNCVQHWLYLFEDYFVVQYKMYVYKDGKRRMDREAKESQEERKGGREMKGTKQDLEEIGEIMSIYVYRDKKTINS